MTVSGDIGAHAQLPLCAANVDASPRERLGSTNVSIGEGGRLLVIRLRTPRALRRSPQEWLAAAARQSLREIRRPSVSSRPSLKHAEDIPAILRLLGEPWFVITTTTTIFALSVLLGVVGIDPGISPAHLIGTLWQVQAAIVGFAVAVTIAAIEAFARTGGARAVYRTAFPASVTVGIGLVFLTGGSFLSGDTTHGRWMVIAAAALSGAWVVLLLYTFHDVARTSEPNYSIRSQLAGILRAAERTVETQLLERVARNVLDQRMQTAGGESVVLPPTTATPEQVYLAPTAGTVQDVSLRHLVRAAGLCRSAGSTLRVSVRLGQYVDDRTPIAFCEPRIPPDARRALEGCLVIENTSEASLDELLEDLTEDATDLIGPRTEVLDEVLNTFEAVLETYADGWRRYVETLTAGILPTLFDVVPAPVDRIRRSTYDLFAGSLRKGEDGWLRVLAYFPERLAGRSVRWKAPAFLGLLNLYLAYYALAGSPGTDPTLLRRYRHMAWFHPVETLRLIIPITVRYADDDERTTGEAAKQELRTVILGLLRQMVDSDDRENFSQALANWRDAERGM